MRGERRGRGSRRGKRMPTQNELVRDAAQRVDVCAAIDIRAATLFWREIQRRADHRTARGVLDAIGDEQLYETKIEKLYDRPLLVGNPHEERVRRLQIAVHESLRVCGLESARDLIENIECLVKRHTTTLEPLVEGFADEMFHHEVAPLIGQRADGCDIDDVRMMERRQRARLALESRERMRVSAHRRRDHLERDPTPELEVLRAIDDAHRAGTELAVYFVVIDDRAARQLDMIVDIAQKPGWRIARASERWA